MSNVLIVDDQALIPPMLGDYLSQFGYTVRIDRSSLGALGWLDLETIDVVVLDIMMPGPMDGQPAGYCSRSDRPLRQYLNSFALALTADWKLGML